MSFLKKTINKIRDALFGRKDPFELEKPKFFDVGHVWAPYVPVYMTPTFNQMSLGSSRGATTLIKINEEPPKNRNKWKKGYMYRVWNKMGTSTALYAFKPNYTGKFKEIPEVVQIGEVKSGDNVMFLEFKILPSIRVITNNGEVCEPVVAGPKSLSYKLNFPPDPNEDVNYPWRNGTVELNFESKKDWYYKVIHNDQVGYIIGSYTDLKRLTPRMIEKEERKNLIKELQKQDEESELGIKGYSRSKLRTDYYGTVKIL